MKINKRSAISQSLDLFIIIAAVLAVGGIVTASIYGLIGSATTNSSIQVTQVSVSGAASPSTTIPAFSITVKNIGSSSISCGGTCTVTISGTVGSASGVCTGATVLSGAVSSGTAPAWSGTCAASNPVVFTTTALVLPAGASVSLSAVGVSALTPGCVTGTSYTVDVVLGAATASIKLTAQ